MVFQNPDNQFVGTTVEDDVAFGLENAGVPQEIMVERVQSALSKVKMNSFLIKSRTIYPEVKSKGSPLPVY